MHNNTVYFFDIGHPCYDQLTPVKTRSADQYHVTISRAQVCSLSRSCVVLKLSADQVLVFDWIAGSCHVNLLKTGQDCLEAC